LHSNFDILDAENAGLAEFVDADGTGHDGKLSCSYLERNMDLDLQPLRDGAPAVLESDCP
jgi:hypothetical protein